MAVATPIDYFDAAMRLLADSGFKGLTIAALCERLGVTSGSFYHHFGSWDGFVDAFLRHWEAEQTRRTIDLSRKPEDPYKRLEVLRQLATNVPHQAEAAIRAWSKNNPAVGASQRRVDQQREAFLRELLTAMIGDRQRAKDLAALGMALTVGLPQLRAKVTPKEMGALYDDYTKLVMLEVKPSNGDAAGGRGDASPPSAPMAATAALQAKKARARATQQV